MSSAKKTRELNRARTEHDNAKLSAQFAASNHAMLNIAESVLAKEIESLHQQLAECQATNGKLRSDMSLFLDSHEECEDFDGFTAQIVSMDDYHKAQDALALPNDATALNELIAERTKELTAEVERLVSAVDDHMVVSHIGVFNRGDDIKEAINKIACYEQGLGEYFGKELRQQNTELTAQRDAAISTIEFAYKVAVEHDDRIPFDWAMYCELLHAAIANCK